MSSFTIQRWLPEGVTPLEIWDLRVGGEMLYRRLGTEHLQALRARGCDDSAIDLELGEALAEAIALLRQQHPGNFEVVVLSGGLAQREGLVEAARKRSPVEIRAVPEPNPILECTDDVLIELGQTALKVTYREVWDRCFRPVPLLPVHRVEDGPVAPETAARLGEQLVTFVSAFVRATLGTPPPCPSPEGGGERCGDTRERPASSTRASLANPLPPPTGEGQEGGVPRAGPRPCPAKIVLALPCALSDAGVPGPCTYAGIDAAWPAKLIEATLRSGTWPNEHVSVRLINDAEWAAYLAQQSGITKPGLAITLGFGPGAAFFGG